MITLKNILIVGLGGMLGSILRYGTSLIMLNIPATIPWPTLVVNIIGSFLIGVLIGFQPKMENYLSLLLITGFCGGFTTFSTFSLENFDFLREGLYMRALVYTCLSVLLGVISVYLGFIITQKA